METKEEVIVFPNLRQATDTIGVYTEVKAKASTKASPFAQSNASGLVRECAGYKEAGNLGAASAKRALSLLAE